MTSTQSVGTITSSMTAVFTPPSSCSSHWTYESQAANSVPGGLLLQDAVYSKTDTPCFPTDFRGWGRAPSFIQIFSPGACPVGYSTANQNYNQGVTTAVCCQSHFSFTSTVSTVNAGNKTAEYYGCTSIYPGDAGVTTVFAEGSGFSSSLDGTATTFTAVSGPITMWGQPITVAFQASDLSLFTTTAQSTRPGAATSTQATSSSTSTLPGITSSTATSSTATSLATGGSTSTGSPGPSPGLQAGAIAGIAIGAAAVFGILIGGAILFRRRKKKEAPGGGGHHQGPMQSTYTDGPKPQFGHPGAQHGGTGQKPPDEWQNQQQGYHTAELSSHTDRRYELS